jgi:hypothetical protein
LLNRTKYDNTLKDELERLTQARTNLDMKKLDTAVTLTSLRDDIRNQKQLLKRHRSQCLLQIRTSNK